MLSFLFGRRKRRTVKRKSIKKPPTRLIKMCRKYKIKCTKKVGKRRVYKSITVLNKQLKRKLKNKKTRKVRRIRKKTRFGEKEAYEVKISGTNLYNCIVPISQKSKTFTPIEKETVLPLIRQFLWDGWTMDVAKAPDGATADIVGVNVNVINVIMELVIPLRLLVIADDRSDSIKTRIFQQLRRILFMEFGMVIKQNHSGTPPPGLNFGKRRVYKSITVLKKQLRRKLKSKKVRKTRRVRRTRFGNNSYPSFFTNETRVNMDNEQRSKNEKKLLDKLNEQLKKQQDVINQNRTLANVRLEARLIVEQQKKINQTAQNITTQAKEIEKVVKKQGSKILKDVYKRSASAPPTKRTAPLPPRRAFAPPKPLPKRPASAPAKRAAPPPKRSPYAPSPPKKPRRFGRIRFGSDEDYITEEELEELRKNTINNKSHARRILHAMNAAHRAADANAAILRANVVFGRRRRFGLRRY
jgi:hypothetical protein